MRSWPRPHLVRIGSLIAAFLFGCLITYLFRSTDTRPWCSASQASGSSTNDDFSRPIAADQPNLLLVLILSAPDNLARRNAIRQTWLPLAAKLAEPLDAERLRAHITVPHFNEAGFAASETTDQQAANLKRQRDTLPKRLLMRRPENFVPVGVRHRFVVGTAGLPRSQLNQLMFEQRENAGDMLLLDGLTDNYQNLTRKLLQTFDAVVYGGGGGSASFEFRYVLKCDDDTYVKLDRLVAELIVYDTEWRAQQPVAGTTDVAVRPELYWGYFSANAHVKTTGKWREFNYVLAERYHPYALGGGYVLSAALVRWVAAHAPQLSQFASEDVSMGLWMSTLRNVYRRHDVRFDTGWMQRKCQDYHLVLHKRSVRDMKMIRGGGLCSGVEDDGGGAPVQRPAEYFYDWTVPVSQCCTRKV